MLENNITIKFKDRVLVEDISPNISILLRGLNNQKESVELVHQNRAGVLDLSDILKRPPSLIVSYHSNNYGFKYILILRASSTTVISRGTFKILWESEGHRLKRVLHEILGEKR